MGQLDSGLEADLQQFKMYLHERNKEASTVKIYACEIRRFLEWMQQQSKELSQIRPEDVISASYALHEQNASYATINKSISIVSSFFKWAKERGRVASNPAEHIRLLTQDKAEPPRWLSEEEEARLVQVAVKERNTFKRTRNEALVAVMLYAGLRVDEVSQLRLESLRNEALIVYEDDAEARRVPIDETTRQKLQAWLAERMQAGKREYAESPFLFVTERSGKMQPRAIQFVIEGFSERLGFPILCQYLRHTYCRRLAERGVPLERIKQQAGHKATLTTWRYFAGLK
ncbi:tyrosine-type recombinase/integrase [Paenibacillus doosanensis]|uniref:Tyrosine recombinase XerC n=1 Tax=Paenibacillus konkukensis TaxID=2020716 RepID=A0ABY4RNE5_9BACL|nr:MULTISPECIES: tyrosine-type recombinase/integrase [Paenibacillus]MCS7460179.1 tyrosine-type recombinase/integrase [Paenibacillus doosanensis]UQZ82837.1 Tyrosine recombinase XerC [Paenibacillus konkukensis]